MTNLSPLRIILEGELESSWNMAVDEALLRKVKNPVARFYGWRDPDVSIGYFQSFHEVPEGRNFVRRYTGGGLVDHREDLTYTLVFAREHFLSLDGPNVSYEKVHAAMVDAFKKIGVQAELSPCCYESEVNACFVKPVKYDVMLDGKKIAGAAQRRTREGSLHQGSILYPFEDREAFIEAFIGSLQSLFGSEGIEDQLSPEELALAQELDRDRYGTEAWTRNR